MGKMKKIRVPFWGKLCAALLLCAAIAANDAGNTVRSVSASGTSADSTIASLQNKVAQLQKQNEERRKQIENIKGDISANKGAMQLVNDQINGIKAELAAANSLIAKKMDLIDEKSAQIDAVVLTITDKECDIKNKRLEIDELNEQNDQNLKKFAKLARALYITDSSITLPVLNGSDDWYDYFVYTDVVKNIGGQNVLFIKRLQNSIAHQETLITELDSSIAMLQTDKQSLENEKAELEHEKTELELGKTKLNQRYAEQYAYVNSLAKKSEQFQSQIADIQVKINSDEELIKKNNAEIDRIIKEAQEANKNQTDYSSGTLLWPVPSKYRTISTYFGYDGARSGQHNGIDIVGETRGEIHNANIYAAQSGTVIVAATLCEHLEPKDINDRHSCGSGYGNYIVIDHGGGMTTVYGHCEKILVQQGQHVTQGDVIGKVGSAGWSTGYHLHFETRVNNVRKDPFSYKYQYKN